MWTKPSQSTKYSCEYSCTVHTVPQLTNRPITCTLIMFIIIRHDNRKYFHLITSRRSIVGTFQTTTATLNMFKIIIFTFTGWPETQGTAGDNIIKLHKTQVEKWKRRMSRSWSEKKERKVAFHQLKMRVQLLTTLPSFFQKFLIKLIYLFFPSSQSLLLIIIKLQ